VRARKDNLAFARSTGWHRSGLTCPGNAKRPNRWNTTEKECRRTGGKCRSGRQYIVDKNDRAIWTKGPSHLKCLFEIRSSLIRVQSSLGLGIDNANHRVIQNRKIEDPAPMLGQFGALVVSTFSSAVRVDGNRNQHGIRRAEIGWNRRSSQLHQVACRNPESMVFEAMHETPRGIVKKRSANDGVQSGRCFRIAGALGRPVPTHLAKAVICNCVAATTHTDRWNDQMSEPFGDIQE